MYMVNGLRQAIQHWSKEAQIHSGTIPTSTSNYPFPLLPAVSFQCTADSRQNNCFFAMKFICAILIDQNEPGIRKQSKAKLKASLNVKIGQGIVNICFSRPAS